MPDRDNNDGRALARRDLEVLWHPCSQMRDYRDFPPLHVVGAAGSRIHLADGRSLLDAISSWWCKALGHGHPRLKAALLDQAQAFEHVLLANTTNEPIVRLCERLLAMANGRCRPAGDQGLAKAFFACDGSMGVEIALKMALQAQAQRGCPQRTLFAHFENGYHGETIATLAVGDCGLYGEPFKPLMFPTLRLTGLPYRSGPQDPRWMDASDEWPAIRNQLDAHAATLTAVILEPVMQGAGGMRLYSPDLLPRLRTWCTAHDVYLVADEIAAGYGRLGAMLATHLAAGAPSPAQQGPANPGPVPPIPSPKKHHAPVLPDFVILSKGLTGGMLPLCAVLTIQAVYDLFDADYSQLRAFMHSNTYFGNALAVAVAHAVLDVFEQEDVLGRVALHGLRLREGLTRIAAARRCLANVRGCGMMAAVDLCDSQGQPLDWRRRTGYAVYRQAVQRGALLRNLGDTMYLMPPLNTPADEIEQMLSILADSVDAAMG